MATFSVSWNPLDQGPLIKIVVMPTDLEMELGRDIGLEYPQPIAINALIDTGSPFTIVNRVLAHTRKLSLTNAKVKLRTLGGECPGDEHCCSISFPDAPLPKIEIFKIIAADFVDESHHSCLIGRDMLRFWKVELDGPNRIVRITA
jgi:hypothetical protein